MMGEPPKSVFLLHQVSQLEGPPPLFCHTLMAVPTRNGASAAGMPHVRRRKPLSPLIVLAIPLPAPEPLLLLGGASGTSR